MNTTHPCPDWRERLSAYHDHQLSGRELCRMEDHLAGCANCRAALAQWDADKAQLTAAYADSTGDAALRMAVLEELHMSTSHPTVPITKYRWALGFAALAFICCIGVLGYKIDASYRRSIMPAGPYTEASIKQPDQPTVMATAPASCIPTKPTLPTATARTPVGSVGEKKGFDAYTAAPETHRVDSYTYDAVQTKADGLAESHTIINGPDTRNYGVRGGVEMAYNVSYNLQVKNALDGARKAQRIIRSHGGFTMDLQYSAADGERPWATFRGKLPADEADKVLTEIEKLGQMRSLNIAGEDLTDQLQQQRDILKQLKGSDAGSTKRALTSLALKHDLVEFSASFAEPKPREPFTIRTLAAITLNVLHYALLALVALAVVAAALAVVTVPIVVLRRLRRRTPINYSQDEKVTADIG